MANGIPVSLQYTLIIIISAMQKVINHSTRVARFGYPVKLFFKTRSQCVTHSPYFGSSRSIN